MSDNATATSDAAPNPGPVQPGVMSTATPLAERSLAPDLARGMMLMLIAMAHVPYFLYNAPTGVIGVHPVVGNLADKIAQVITITVVDARVYTMFGFLFAYGVGQMYARQTARDIDPADVRRLLRRRNLWMLAFGAVHAALLWQGDIIGAYGLIGLIMVPLFLQRSDRTLKVWIGVLLALAALSAIMGALTSGLDASTANLMPSEQQRTSIAEPSYLTSILARLPVYLVTVMGSLFGLALPAAFVMGLLAARHRVLDEPGRFLPLLRVAAIGGIAVGWISGLALAAAHVGIADRADDATLIAAHTFFGIFAGIGYAALFGLVAHRLTRRGGTPSRASRWVGALGRRSMSGYLVQSLAWGPLLAAWGLGLGAHLSSWSALSMAIAVWATSVLVAAAMEHHARRGPAEVALRRLTYRAGRT